MTIRTLFACLAVSFRCSGSCLPVVHWFVPHNSIPDARSQLEQWLFLFSTPVKYVARPFWDINLSPLQHHSIQKYYLLQTSYYTTKVLRDNHPWSTVYNIQHNALVSLFGVSLSSRGDIYNTWQDLLHWAVAGRQVQQLFSRRH